jgi:hypothetical protein
MKFSTHQIIGVKGQYKGKVKYLSTYVDKHSSVNYGKPINCTRKEKEFPNKTMK